MISTAGRLFAASIIFSWLAALSIIIATVLGDRDEDDFFPRLAIGLFGLAVIAVCASIFFLFVGMLV